MRSIYRIKRLVISSNCQISTPARRLSSSTSWSNKKSSAAELDLSDLGRFEASTSTPSNSRWSDAGARSQGESSSSTSISPPKQSGFFTPFRPSSLPVPPASQVDLQKLNTLYPLLYRHPDTRDEEFCTQVWRQYHHLAPSTRRSLHPKIMQMVLRAVIPSRATRTEMKRRAKDPVRAIDAYSEKMERRLQIIIADMLRSTYVDPSTNQRAVIPNNSDYQYALEILAHLGGTEACEAIYREINENGQGSRDGQSLLPYRLEALKVWMTGRVKYSNWTRIRPGSSSAETSSKKSSMRYRSESETKDPAVHAITVLWSILGELSHTPSTDSTKLFRQLILALHQILRFLPETEKSVRDTVRKILKQSLEKGYGIDFKFLRQDPAVQTEMTPEIVDSVMYLMGSQGDIWRMIAMYESLTGASASSSSTQSLDLMDADEDMGETLSGALEAEAESGVNRDWLGREKISSAPAPSEVPTRERPPHLPAMASPSGYLSRHFNEYLPRSSSWAISEEGESVAPIVSPLGSTSTITTMMESIKKSGNVDLAIHLLRTSLRDAADVRQAWLSELSSSSAQLTISGAGTQSVEVEEVRSTSQTTEDTPEVVQATTAASPTREISTVELAPRRLLVSAQWFEAVHLLARSGSDTIWAATEIRRLMDAELKSLTEEHLLLSGIPIEEPLDEISRSAPIYSIQTLGGDKRPFDPTRHLRHLRKTFWELSKMITISVQQQERRRAATRAKNARRAERSAIALKAEQERVDAKQALRKRRDEIQEVPLALA